MTNDEVHSTVVRWVASLTSLVTIKAYQAEKSPPLPYIMVNLTGIVAVRDHEIEMEYVEEADPLPGDEFPLVTATPLIETEWRFSVHVFGPQAAGYFRPILSGSKVPQVLEPISPLIIHEMSQVRHVPEMVNANWQDRAQADLIVRGLVRSGHIVNVIEEISFDIEPMA